jgi:hypothetical protein
MLQDGIFFIKTINLKSLNSQLFYYKLCPHRIRKEPRFLNGQPPARKTLTQSLESQPPIKWHNAM